MNPPSSREIAPSPSSITTSTGPGSLDAGVKAVTYGVSFVLFAYGTLVILTYDAEIAVPYPVGGPGCPASVTPCPGCGTP